MLYKDQSDQGLADSITSLQGLLYVAGHTGHRVHYLARQLDIAVAVKRQRVRAGTWNPAPVRPPQGAALSDIRAWDKAQAAAALKGS